MFLPPDAELVRRDPALPGLGLLLDPDVFADMLRSSLPEAAVGAARSSYVRYKPGMNCLVAYQLELAGMTVDVYAKAYTSDAWGKLNKAREQPSVSGPLGPGRMVMDAQHIVVSIFPNDSKLKSLAYLASADKRCQLLGRIMPDRPDLVTGTVCRIRYKPERRCVVRVSTVDGPQAVLRFYTEQGYGTACSTIKPFTSRGLLRLARRLGRSKRHGAVAFEWLPGRPLNEYITNSDLGVTAVTMTGAALAELHTHTPNGLAYMTREAEAATLVALAKELAFLCPHLTKQVWNLAQQLARRLIQEPPVTQSIHGDFYADQVLLIDDAIAILDLDRAACSDPAVDLGVFIAHLERNALSSLLPPDRVRLLRDALLDGYRADMSRTTMLARVELYTAVGLLHLAPDPFRSREPDWPSRIEAILARAETILNAASPHITHYPGNLRKDWSSVYSGH